MQLRRVAGAAYLNFTPTRLIVLLSCACFPACLAFLIRRKTGNLLQFKGLLLDFITQRQRVI
jgi:hypothetical protein